MEEHDSPRGHLLRLIELLDGKVDKGVLELGSDVVTAHPVKQRLEDIAELINQILSLL